MKWFRENLLNAVCGLLAVFRTQRSARIQLAAAVFIVAAGFFFGIDHGEWLAVVLAIGGVITAEAFNTALEALADAAHPERHPLVGRAKDAAAGAVLVATIAAAAIGTMVFLPKTLSWLSTLLPISPTN